jgi:hypothetical protein
MFRRRRYDTARPQLADHACFVCGNIFRSRYLGRSPKCQACFARERRVNYCQELLGGALRRWRERKISHLIHEAEASDVSAIVRLLKTPDYLRLLQTATPELMREVQDDQMTSFRAYIPASLLSTLCARINPNTPIPATLPVLIRPMLAALSTILYPPSTDLGSQDLGLWTHPVNFLCRGDPLFKECRAALLGDLRWGPDIHALLPHEIQETYVLLITILCKNNVHVEGIFQSIIAFFPPVVRNTSSRFAFKTVLEIAEDLGAMITQALWEEVTLSMLSTLMSMETGEHVHPTQLATLDFRYPDFFELEGVAGVPERRSSGRACLSLAFVEHHAQNIQQRMIMERIVTVQNVSAASLGLPSPSKVATTKQQYQDLKDVAQAADPNSVGIYSNWLKIHDDTAIEEARRGPAADFDDILD